MMLFCEREKAAERKPQDFYDSFRQLGSDRQEFPKSQLEKDRAIGRYRIFV